MIAGLSVSTFVTLFLVPVVYCLFHWPELRRERRSGRAAGPAGGAAATPLPAATPEPSLADRP
jgi:hypothetical protein